MDKIDAVQLLINLYKRGFYSNTPIVKSIKKSSKDTPFKVLIRCIISQRTRDEQTFKISKNLFKIAKTPQKILELGYVKLKNILYGAGFYSQKAKRIIEICNIIKRKGFPKTYEELITLPGVGNKTANIVLAYGLNIPAIAVDTHVHRISNRIGLCFTKDPYQTQLKLRKIIPKKYWIDLNHVFVAHGQLICKPRTPFCDKCPIISACDFAKTKARIR